MSAFAVIIISLFSLRLFVLRLNSFGNASIINYQLFQLVMAILYLGVGVILRSVGVNFYGVESLGFVQLPKYNALIDAYSIYFIFVFYMFYVLDKKRVSTEKIIDNFMLIKSKWLLKSLKALALSVGFVGVLLLMVYLKDYPRGVAREALFAYSAAFSSAHGVGYLFYFCLAFSFYISMTTKKKRYFLLPLPLMLIELSSGGRIYLVQYVLFIFVSHLIMSRKPIPLKLPVLLLSFILSVGLIRGLGSDFDSIFSIVVYTFGEFINTADSIYIALDSDYSYDLASYLAYSLSRTLPSVFSNTFLNLEFTPLVNIIDSLKYNYLPSDFNVGLGGSILADAIFISKDAPFFMYLYPIIMGVGGVVINYLLRQGYSPFVYLFIFSIGNLFLIFRYGFFPNVLHSVSNVLFFGYIFILMSIYAKRDSNGQ